MASPNTSVGLDPTSEPAFIDASAKLAEQESQESQSQSAEQAPAPTGAAEQATAPAEPAEEAPKDKSERSCFQKMIYWRVGLLAPPSIPDSSNKFETIFSQTNAALHSVLLPFAIITFVTLFMNLCTKWDVNPRWKDRIPCTFQSEMSDFFDHYKAGVRALLVLDLFPAGCAIVCCIFYLHGRPGKAEPFTHKKRPLLGWLAIGWAWKVIVPLFMFTFINFKQPTYIPYGAVTKKACEVVLSLTFNPPGASSNGYISSKYENLRTVTGSYFGNALNYKYPQYSNFESTLAGLNPGTDTTGWGATAEDSSSGCNYVDDDSTFFSEISKFLNVPSSIKNYCDKGYDITSDDRDKGPMWPVIVLADHMQNYVNGLSILQHACAGSATTVQGDPYTTCNNNAGDCPDKLLAATITTAATEGVTLYDVCSHWYTCTTQTCCKDETVTKSDGTESTLLGGKLMECHADDYTATTGTTVKVRALSSTAHKQAICMIHRTFYDPKLGYKALPSQLCPASTPCTTTEDSDCTGTTNTVTPSYTDMTNAVATQSAIDTASVVALGQARQTLTRNSFQVMFPGYNYTGLAELIHDDATSMVPTITTDATRYDRATYTRWTEQDSVAMMQIAMAYMKYQFNSLITTAGGAGDTLTGATAAISQEYVNLGKNMDVSMFHAMYNIARKASLSTSSAINKIGQLVGIFAGFMAVITLVPFSVSVLTGMISGAKTVKAMIKTSDCMHDERDTRKVNTFLSMILTNCIALVAIPLIAIPIFIYQAYADQTFVMTVLGFMIVVIAFFVGSFDTVTQQGNRNWYIFGAEILGWFLVFMGILIWMIYDEFSILRDAINFLVEKFFILIIIGAVIVHVLSDMIDPEKIDNENLVIALFVFKCVWLVLSIIFGLLFFASESGDWAMFIDAIQMFILWIFNSKLTALVTMNATVLILGKMFEDFDVVQYRGDSETGQLPVDSGLHKLGMFNGSDDDDGLSLPCMGNKDGQKCCALPCMGNKDKEETTTEKTTPKDPNWFGPKDKLDETEESQAAPAESDRPDQI